MAASVKNLTFPFGVRHTQQKKNNAITSIPLSKLGHIGTLKKTHQPLVQYNFKVIRYRDRFDNNRFRCKFTDKYAAQTVIVLDFDGIKSAYAQKDALTSLWDAFRITPILEETTNGFHVILPFNVSVNSDDGFRHCVEGVAKVLPDYLREHLDPKSFSRSQHWYHVRFFDNWIKKDFINITARQQKNGVFFNSNVSLDIRAMFRIFAALMYDLSQVSDDMLRIFFARCAYFTQRRSENEPEFIKITTEFLYRILVEVNGRRGSDRILSEIRKRTEEIQRQTQGHFFTCEPDVAIRAVERLFGVDGELADRTERGGSAGSAYAHSGSAEETAVFCDAGNSQESDGNSSGCSSGNEKHPAGRLPDHRSVECVLAFVSEFQSLLRREQLIVNSVGYFISADRLRSNEHRGDEPKEQDHSLFDGVCRQILERHYGKFGAAASPYVRLYEWFRYTSRHLGNIEHDGRCLSKIADEILRGMRLFDTRFGTGRLQEVIASETNWLKFRFKDQEEIDSLIDSFFDCTWRERVGNEKYAERLLAFRKNHPARFREGMENMFGWLARMRGRIQERSVDIGKNMFVYWFGSDELASYLRKLILEKLAMTNHMYSPFQRTKRWFFSSDFLDTWARRFSDLIATLSVVKPETLAEKMGNGQTFSTISKTVVSLVSRWGGDAQRVKDFMLEALSLSCANDQRQRQRDIDKYVDKVVRLLNNNQLKISHGGAI
jgi:hypothetical protein